MHDRLWFAAAYRIKTVALRKEHTERFSCIIITDRVYSPAPCDGLIKFGGQRWKVRVTACGDGSVTVRVLTYSERLYAICRRHALGRRLAPSWQWRRCRWLRPSTWPRDTSRACWLQHLTTTTLALFSLSTCNRTELNCFWYAAAAHHSGGRIRLHVDTEVTKCSNNLMTTFVFVASNGFLFLQVIDAARGTQWSWATPNPSCFACQARWRFHQVRPVAKPGYTTPTLHSKRVLALVPW